MWPAVWPATNVVFPVGLEAREADRLSTTALTGEYEKGRVVSGVAYELDRVQSWAVFGMGSSW